MVKSLKRHYRYVRRHPVGKWALMLVWVGLGVALTSPYVALIPIALERRGMLKAAGVQLSR